MSNMRKDILDSYKILIRECENNINNDVNAKENLMLISEYNEIINSVKRKSEEEYLVMEKEIKDLYDYSNLIHEIISTVIPFKRYN